MFLGTYSFHLFQFSEAYVRQACGTLPSQWFKRRRGLANGLVFAGGGLGGCIQSIVMQILIDRLGILWTFRIIGSITLFVTMPAAMLLKERHTHVTAKIDWYYHSSAIRTLLDLSFSQVVIQGSKIRAAVPRLWHRDVPFTRSPLLHTDVCIVAQHFRKLGFSASCPVQHCFRCRPCWIGSPL